MPIALAAGLLGVLLWAHPAEAKSRGRCPTVCRDAIAACVAEGGAPRACRHAMLARCRVEGPAACAPADSRVRAAAAVTLAGDCYVRPHGPFGTGTGDAYANAKGNPFQCMAAIGNGASIIVWGNPWDDHDAYERASGPQTFSPSGAPGAIRTLRGATAAEDQAAGNTGAQQCPFLSGFRSLGPWTEDVAAGPDACGSGRRRWFAVQANAQSLRQYDLWERKAAPPAVRCAYDAHDAPLFLTTNFNVTDYHRGSAVPNHPGSGKTLVNAPGKWTQGDAGETTRIYYCPVDAEDPNTLVIKAVGTNDDDLLRFNTSYWTLGNVLVGGVSGEDGSGNAGNGGLLFSHTPSFVTLDHVDAFASHEGVINLIVADGATDLTITHSAVEYAHSYGINGNNLGGPCPTCCGTACTAMRNLRVDHSRFQYLMQHALGLSSSAGGGHKGGGISDTQIVNLAQARYNRDGEDITNVDAVAGRGQHPSCLFLREVDDWTVERIWCQDPDNGGVELGGDVQATSDGSTGVVVRDSGFHMGPDTAGTDEGANCFNIGSKQAHIGVAQTGPLFDALIERNFCDTSAASQAHDPAALSACFWGSTTDTTPIALVVRNNICVSGPHTWAAFGIVNDTTLGPSSVIANNTIVERSGAANGCNAVADGGCGFFQQNATPMTIGEFSNNVFVGYATSYQAPAVTLASCRTNVSAPQDVLPASCTGTSASTPLFVDGPAYDAAGLHLAADDTVAVDTATTLSSFSDDFDGGQRPAGAAWDRGACEQGAVPGTTTTTSTAPPTTTVSTTTSTSSTTPPAVGTCGNPLVIPAAGGTVTGSTAGASALSGCVSATAGAPERVFSWTPSVSGAATIQTCGTGTKFDTVLIVRTGSCTGGTQVACNDDTTGCGTGDACTANNNHHGSRVAPTVTAGQTYYLIVDGYSGSCGGSSGAFALTVVAPTPATTSTTTSSTSTITSTTGSTPPTTSSTSTTTPPSTSSTSTSTTSSTTTPPTTSSTSTTRTTNTIASTTTTVPGGPCANPTIIPGAGGTFTGETSGRSALSGSCTTATGGAPEKVFAWTPARSGVASITTCGTGTKFDTVLYVRSGSCTGGTQVACNDDSAGCGTGDTCTANNNHHGSRLAPTVTAGQTYYIVVDGYNGSCGGSAGMFALTVTPP